MAPGYDLLRTVTKTAQDPVEATIHGKIPQWLSGSLYRNGPGRYELEGKGYKHLFDGHALIHKYKIDAGKVHFSSNFLNTKCYTKSTEENRLYEVFGTADLCSNFFGRFKMVFELGDTMDNVNVNIVPFGNQQLYALTETNYMCKVNPDSLSVTDTYNVTKFIDTASTTIAHPHADTNGNWITMGMNNKSKRASYYEFVRFKNGPSVDEKTNMCEQGEVIGRFPSSHSGGLSYFHSFGVTENYIIFLGANSLQIERNKTSKRNN
jgi:carotenoid cleavage dioxygenase-like enzyme